MKEFFESDYELIIGCDPGPEHSAFALFETETFHVMDVSYVPNKGIGECRHMDDLCELLNKHAYNQAFDCEALIRKSSAFVFEKCAVQAGGANAMVFETCMTAGEIRHLFMLAELPAFAFTPSDWRYVLTGKGCAKDADVRNILLTLDPDCDIIPRHLSNKERKVLNLRKPITSHLRDAIGVAMASGFLEYKKGLKLSQFPARLEVHCG